MKANGLKNRPSSGFTLVEVAVTIVVVGLIVGSSMTILDRLIGAMGDMRLRSEAFEIARQNMETLLSETKAADLSEYGTSEICPEVQWQTAIEPFYEPISKKMWIRAVCSAGFNDSKGQYQSIDLEHWLTNLSADVVRQIIQQQKAEDDYLDLLSGTASGQEEAAVQETTMAYLEEAGLDVDKYSDFLDQQRNQKLDYISKKGFDDGYDTLIEELREDENVFLQALGMDFGKYNTFARAYVPQSSGSEASDGKTTAKSDLSEGKEKSPDNLEQNKPLIDPPVDDPKPPSTDKPKGKQKITAEFLRSKGVKESSIPLLLQLLGS